MLNTSLKLRMSLIDVHGTLLQEKYKTTCTLFRKSHNVIAKKAAYISHFKYCSLTCIGYLVNLEGSMMFFKSVG